MPLTTLEKTTAVRKRMDSGERLREIRKSKGLRQQDLADEIGEAGVSQVSVSRWEREGIPEYIVDQVAEVLDVSVDDLNPDDQGSEADQEYVTSGEDVRPWRNAVSRAQMDPDLQVLLMALPLFIDEKTGIVTLKLDDFAQEVPVGRTLIGERWGDVIDSPFVERIGHLEWVLRLAFPGD